MKFFFLLFLIFSAQAADIVLYFSSQEMERKDVNRIVNKNIKEIFQDKIKLINGGSLYKGDKLRAPMEILSRLYDGKDKIVGFIFLAHGYKDKLVALSPDEQFFSGEEFARYLFEDSFDNKVYGENFFVYLHSCDLGKECKDGKNFQNSFFNESKRIIKENDIPIKNLDVLTFTQPSNAMSLEDLTKENKKEFVENYINERQAKGLEEKKKSTFEHKAMEIMFSPITEDAAEEYQKSKLNQFLSWDVFFRDQGLKGAAVLGTTFALSNLAFSPIVAIPLTIALHVWATKNSLSSLRLAKLLSWDKTSDKTYTFKGTVRKLFTSRICNSFF